MKPLVRSWCEADLARLRQMVLAGASVSRCSAALNRPTNSVRNQARRMGVPFPGIRAVKATQKMKIAAAERTLSPGSLRYDGSRA
ncbi:MAG: hypothetical protein JWR89_2540 [Tardiphaga sp.]|jgi:hypothetical protein|uniref:hypothetical protein n=1 Tax=Tardiphaga sp. TaxID=1926292 RepID=UPI00260AB83F|nr:hypothetical protein [Tardiphaga sp.]MDB5502638.1 hypothetical protein [Tardiphaga sp.]